MQSRKSRRKGRQKARKGNRKARARKELRKEKENPAGIVRTDRKALLKGDIGTAERAKTIGTGENGTGIGELSFVSPGHYPALKCLLAYLPHFLKF